MLHGISRKNDWNWAISYPHTPELKWIELIHDPIRIRKVSCTYNISSSLPNEWNDIRKIKFNLQVSLNIKPTFTCIRTSTSKFFCHPCQGSEIKSAFYLMGTRNWSGRSVKLITHLHRYSIEEWEMIFPPLPPHLSSIALNNSGNPYH
jgi:hypothetical protein